MTELTREQIEEKAIDLPIGPQVFDTVCRAMVVDRGLSLQLEIYDGNEDENGMFVRVLSWDTTKEHALMRRLLGKHVRVTVEVVEAAEKSETTA